MFIQSAFNNMVIHWFIHDYANANEEILENMDSTERNATTTNHKEASTCAYALWSAEIPTTNIQDFQGCKDKGNHYTLITLAFHCNFAGFGYASLPLSCPHIHQIIQMKNALSLRSPIALKYNKASFIITTKAYQSIWNWGMNNSSHCWFCGV